MIMFLLSLYFKVGKILILIIIVIGYLDHNFDPKIIMNTKILCHLLAYDTLDPICMILFIGRGNLVLADRLCKQSKILLESSFVWQSTVRTKNCNSHAKRNKFNLDTVSFQSKTNSWVSFVSTLSKGAYILFVVQDNLSLFLWKLEMIHMESKNRFGYTES
jgi:hypothetical protein